MRAVKALEALRARKPAEVRRAIEDGINRFFKLII